MDRNGKPIHNNRAFSVVFQRDHGFRTSDVIGRCSNFRLLKLSTGDLATVCDIRFGSNDAARETAEQYQNETTSDFSVGFLADETRDPTDEEARKGIVEVISRATLIEVSAVVVGANPDASTLARQVASLQHETAVLTRALARATAPRSTDPLTRDLLKAELVAVQVQLAALALRVRP